MQNVQNETRKSYPTKNMTFRKVAYGKCIISFY